MNVFFTWQARALSYPVTMSRITLRLLLALCLLLNGIGNAMAAIAMPAMSASSHDAMMVMTDAEAQSEKAACGHAHSAPTASAPVTPPTSPPASHPADCDKDCCARGACTCPCMHVVQGALLDMAFVAPLPRGTSLVAVLAMGHSTPVLLNLNRPPIG